MKRTRITAISFIAALMLIGAGYAAQSDNLKIKSTAVSGDLKIEFREKIRDYHADFNDGMLSSRQYTATKAANDTRSVEYVINNIYPGLITCETFDFTNMGKIPAIIGDITVTFDTGSSEVLKTRVKVFGAWRLFEKESIESKKLDDDIIGLCPLKDLENNLNASLKGKTLNPGNVLSFERLDNPVSKSIKSDLSKAGLTANEINILTGNAGLKFILPLNTDDNNTGTGGLYIQPSEDQSISFTITLNFKQYNDTRP